MEISKADIKLNPILEKRPTIPSFTRWTSLPPEIWMVVGEKIASRVSLQNLALACRDFHTIFKSLLCAVRSVRLHRRSFRGREGSKPKLLPPGLRSTTHLEIHLGMNSAEIPWNTHETAEHWKKDTLDYIICMLIEAPFLNYFTFIDQFNHNVNDIVSNTKLLQILKSRQYLKHVAICHDIPDLGRFPSTLSLLGFQNLVSLELINISAASGALAVDIGRVLAVCPKMDTLNLALACDIDNEDNQLIFDTYGQPCFLGVICSSYAAMTERRLALSTLQLGRGMSTLNAESQTNKTENINFLALLLDLSKLRNLDIFNGKVMYNVYQLHGLDAKLDWQILDECTSLNRFVVTTLNRAVQRWLMDERRKCVRELIVIKDDAIFHEPAMELYDQLLSHMSMVYIFDVAFRLAVLEADESQYNSNSRLSSSRTRRYGAEHLLSTQGAILPSQTIPIMNTGFEESRVTQFLYNLHSLGSDLTSLALFLDFDPEIDFFLEQISHFKSLRRLRIATHCFNNHEWGTPEYPHDAWSRWPILMTELPDERSTPEEVAKRYALLMHASCPSLQLINIVWYAWQFVTDSNGKVEVHSLDRAEQRAIDLLSIHQHTRR